MFLYPVDGNQEVQAQQSDIQGVIKLAKYASWPADKQNGKTTIMIAPQSDETFQLALDNGANSKILDSDVEIKRISNIEEAISQADVIFIESGTSVDADKIIEMAAGRHILTITNDMDILDKGCMFYVKHDGGTEEFSYLYNKDAVLASSLDISAHILAPDHKYRKQ
ncbi:MAG: YfiR family protein [Bacteroidales bacterium]|nr:YfiR family protein [Bacteroidales bacterium]